MNGPLLGLPFTVVDPCVALPQAPVASSLPLDFFAVQIEGKASSTRPSRLCDGVRGACCQHSPNNITAFAFRYCKCLKTSLMSMGPAHADQGGLLTCTAQPC